MVEQLFLAVPRGCLRFVIVVFPDHTHLLFTVVWLTLCMTGNFSRFFCLLSTSFKIKVFKTFFRNAVGVSNDLGSRSGPTFCLQSYQPLADRELI